MDASQILVARSTAELEYACGRLSSSLLLGCDTETGGLNARTSRLLSVQISDGNFAVLVPASEGIRLGPLASLLSSPAHLKVFHNAGFDLKFLAQAGYEVRHIFDSMIAEKLITRGADQSSSLAETLYRYFAVDLNKNLRGTFSDRSWDGRWSAELVEYALSDVIYLPPLQQQQAPWLERLGLMREFRQRMARFSSADD